MKEKLEEKEKVLATQNEIIADLQEVVTNQKEEKETFENVWMKNEYDIGIEFHKEGVGRIEKCH